jgi:hypothetical protein
MVLKMSGRLVGQKNLKSLRKTNQRIDMEDKIDSVMSSFASGVSSEHLSTVWKIS